MEILIAEDEKQIADSLKKNFLAEGHNAFIAADGHAALQAVEKIVFDAILLDWRMPGISGFEVIKILRQKGFQTPIILLTALADISNKIEALNAGADDYITKPFSFEEVLARIQASVRRFNSTTTFIPFGNLSLNLITHSLDTPTKSIKLSEKEFDLLHFFLLNKGRILSKEILCEKVWDSKCIPSTNFIEVTLKNLRKKIEAENSKHYIKTIYGEGYIFLAD